MESTEDDDRARDAAVQIRRIYEEPQRTDGFRALVDRLWPRGVSKERAHLDGWFKDIAPTTELRQWYAHIPDRFVEFTARYREELVQPEQAAELQRLRDISATGPLTLLTATKDVDISEAAVIAQLLRER
ncbi:DUF488 domain-containing protein [Leifsonia sp. NPDC058230]|uniref:DUF488 domain-containing protein n=1 Tax=Leifsonia sp. NPDC058230 TaxID=3346391 RepID=UPI0036DD3FCF